MNVKTTESEVEEIINQNIQLNFMENFNLLMQQTANNRAASSGGIQSGKNGVNTYVLNVKATIACEHGRTIMHSIHKRMNAMNGPKVSIMYA